MRCMWFAALMVVGACGAPQGIALGSSGAAGDSQEDEEIPICAEEVATGTNINRVVCRSRSQVESEKRAAREWRSRNGADPTRNGVHITHDPLGQH